MMVWHFESLQKRVAMVGVSLIVVLILVGIGLYVSPEKLVGKAKQKSPSRKVYI